MDRDELLHQLKTRLEEAYGKRLHGVVLFGSEARGDAQKDSDIDVLVILKGPIVVGKDIHISIQALYPLMLEIERPIHPLPAEINNYNEGVISLYRVIKAEGIPV